MLHKAGVPVAAVPATEAALITIAPETALVAVHPLELVTTTK